MKHTVSNKNIATKNSHTAKKIERTRSKVTVNSVKAKGFSIENVIRPDQLKTDTTRGSA